MSLYLFILLIFHLYFKSISSIENQLHFYMDNQTLCNQNLVDLTDAPTWRVYSHSHFHNKYMYFADTHCSITIRTTKRVWMSIEYFQSNSSSSFPRCTEAKYAGVDDRLQIIDGFKTGSILRIICGKDTDQRFDRTALILKSSIFTIDWQTKSQALGFELKFVTYDLSSDGKCFNSSRQFYCQNRRCIDSSLICFDKDYCGDNSHLNSVERMKQCRTRIAKQKLHNWSWMFILSLVCCCVLMLVLITVGKFCQQRRKK
ncbi:unnamed protein product [Adineta ricciae]|uniref:CUB domain-containing protein n=2 Tax=Adineta ricciae TaxID=249248 RepID=A0A814IIW2_ADIRI|nr:unnamed protein product [Adineta ricciae]